MLHVCTAFRFLGDETYHTTLFFCCLKILLYTIELHVVAIWKLIAPVYHENVRLAPLNLTPTGLHPPLPVADVTRGALPLALGALTIVSVGVEVVEGISLARW
jgi:hypothetical protein